jgi:hypothetical protein
LWYELSYVDIQKVSISKGEDLKQYMSAKDTFLVIREEERELLHLQKRQAELKPYSKRSIFEKYTFFNTAVMMGIFTMVLLLYLGYYAMRMLLGLQTPTRYEEPVKR